MRIGSRWPGPLAIVFLSCSLLLGGCAPAEGADGSIQETPGAWAPVETVESTAAPLPGEPTPTPTSAPGGATEGAEGETGIVWRALPIGEDTAVDLDGDGEPETVALTVGAEDTARVTVGQGDRVFTEELGYFYAPVLFLGDTLAGDGHLELYVFGDAGSDDYVTKVFRLEGGALQQAELYGVPLSIDGEGTLSLETVVQILGTWVGRRNYTMLFEPGFAFVESGPTDILQSPELWEWRGLTLQRDGMPATLVEEEGDAPTVLAAGTRLLPLSTDEASYVLCQTGEGGLVRLEVTRPPEDWEWYIGGVSESQWFGELFYAG